MIRYITAVLVVAAVGIPRAISGTTCWTIENQLVCGDSDTLCPTVCMIECGVWYRYLPTPQCVELTVPGTGAVACRIAATEALCRLTGECDEVHLTQCALQNKKKCVKNEVWFVPSLDAPKWELDPNVPACKHL